MTDAQPPALDALLSHERSLRRIAAALVPAHEVDDLVQETWAAAAAARSLTAPRAWLSRVLRNLAARRHRGAARRTARERAAAVGERTPSTAEMLERLEAHRLLAAAVAALEEPYRQTVLLRFFEELPPQEIARRLRVPASTVRTRIERGLARLRGRLGGRDLRAVVALVLLPRSGERIAAAAGAGTTTATWGLLMTLWHHKAAAAAALLIVLATAFFAPSAWRDDRAAAGPAPPGAAQIAAAGSGAGVAGRSPADSSRAAGRMPAAAPEPVPEAPPPAWRFVDPRGEALHGVPVLLERAPAGVRTFAGAGRLVAAQAPVPAGTTGPDGRFAPEGGHLDVAARAWTGAGWVTLATSTLDPRGRGREGIVVAVAAVLLQGRVVDPHGQPLAGVDVAATTAVLDGCPVPLEGAEQTALPAAATDADGSFAIEAPATGDLVLVYTKAGYRPVREAGAEAVFRHVVLEPRQRPRYHLAGTVVGGDRRPVAGATIVVGDERVRSGPAGQFAAAVDTLAPGAIVLAAKRGHRPTRRDDLVGRLLREHRVEDVEIELGGPPLDLTGVVVDQDGGPVAALVVAVWRPVDIHMFTTAADLASGREGEMQNLGNGPVKVDARTDAAGRFTVTGLGEEPCRLRIFDPSTLVSVTTGPAIAGRPLRVVFPAGERRTLRGVVRDRSGRPLASVRVEAALETWRSDTLTLVAPAGSTKSGEGGAFELRDVPAGDTIVTVSGPLVIEQSWPLAELPADAPADLRPWRRCRFRLERPGCAADRLRVLDAQGGALSLWQTRGAVSRTGEGWDVTDGTAPVLEVSEEAATVVLLDRGEEVLRIPVRLDPGAVTVVH